MNSAIENNHERIAILVDVQNLYHSAKTLYRGKVDYNHLYQTIANERTVLRAIAYAIQVGEHSTQSFYAALRKIGFTVRSKDLLKRADGSAKGDWDMGMAIDAIGIFSRVDTVVLATGDGDFADLIDYLKHQGVKVEVYAFPETTSHTLYEVADKVVGLGREFIIPSEDKGILLERVSPLAC